MFAIEVTSMQRLADVPYEESEKNPTFKFLSIESAHQLSNKLNGRKHKK